MKYEYIPDKKMYAAVMGACAYIRNTGWFNKAVNYYADKYNVDADQLAEHIRRRQSVGQKASTKKRKYYWYAVEYSMGNERNGCDYFSPLEARYTIKRGMSAENVKNALSKRDDFLSEYAPVHWFGRVQQCDTQDEASELINLWAKEQKRL